MPLSIVISFLILVSLILWITIKLKSYWLLKLFIILLSVSWSISIYNGFESFIGWASRDEPPNEFLLRKALVKEPNKRTGAPGSIHLLLQKKKVEEKNLFEKFFKYNDKKGEPRLYVLPYTKNMHKQIQGVRKALNRNTPVLVKKKGKNGQDGQGQNGQEGQDGQGGQQGSGMRGENGNSNNGRGSLSNYQIYEFHILPPPKLPDKVK